MAIDKEVLDQLLAGRDPQELFAKDGLIDELKKALSERMLSAELDDYLENEIAAGAINRRNGSSKKTVLTGTSKPTLEVPRDRAGTFDPKLITKYQRRFPDFDDKIISMYARGMTVREIRGHLEELYGIDVSPDLISTITDAVLEAVADWQGRPLDLFAGKSGLRSSLNVTLAVCRCGLLFRKRGKCASFLPVKMQLLPWKLIFHVNRTRDGERRYSLVCAYPREAQEMEFDAHDEAFAFLKHACTRRITWPDYRDQLSAGPEI